MGTTNSDLLPNSTGQNLGSPDQEWDGFFRNATFTGQVSNINLLNGDGNAIALQSRPISTSAPAPSQVLGWDGMQWLPINQSGAGGTVTLEINGTPNGSQTILNLQQGTFLTLTDNGIGTITLNAAAQTNALTLQGRALTSTAPTLNQVVGWNGAAWAPQTVSGGGGAGGYVVTTFSATPTFTPSPVGSCTFVLTLTGNVTSSTFTTAGLSAGQQFTFILIEDGTGGRTFAWPALALGTQPIGTTAAQTTVATFVWNGANLIPLGFPTSF